MDTIIIQVKNNLVYKILKNLEELRLIKVIKRNTSSETKLSAKYAGSLSQKDADALHNFVNESRNEWDNRNI